MCVCVCVRACARRCYTQSIQPTSKPVDESQKELEPIKLPGKLAEYTGNVLYPNDDSAVWDVNGEDMHQANYILYIYKLFLSQIL